ncbi:type II toxin-antitoxin system RelE/ParE family toxin [Nocardia vinacea]|uniref:type II toxin-antitoxin system RelE family toxin n=1 Tax=Nocardia vinacea TaxID=96468 RepID=UPI002E11087F|nr:type II toxin-antitoxin system RelE/ParE family toxin [Nocardia vinacea]
MKYRFELTPEAQQDIRNIPKTDAIRLLQKLAQLGDDPYAPNNAVKPMAGEYVGFYRLRCGDYRAIYRVENNRLLILVIAAGGRDVVYR